MIRHCVLVVNSMYISKLDIINYKNFSSSSFRFVNGSVNTIIGENAAGKTNAFQAMRLILDDSLPANAKQLSVEDFHRGLGNPFGHWIIISIEFAELGNSEEEQVLANYILNDINEEVSTGNGKYTFIFRPKTHIRANLHELSSNEGDIIKRKEIIDKYISEMSISRDTYEAIAFVRTKIDFTVPDVYIDIVGDFEKNIFPNPIYESFEKIGVKKTPYFSLVSEVACTYVKALRNVVADLKHYKTNPLYKLLTLQSNKIDDRNNVAKDIVIVNEKISAIPEIKSLSNNISRSLLNTVGSTYSPKISISSQLPEDFSELIQSLGLIVEDSYNYTGTGKIEDMSLGGANLIYLALKLYEYEAIRDSEEHITHFLMIEEPEAHIHNHIQKALFNNFNFNNTQVFISTHSTQISSVAKISSMNILSRKEDKTEVYDPIAGLDKKSVKCIERYLDAIRSDILFSKSTILVEGDAELILIPELIKKTLGISLDEMGISLVKMDGTVFKHISELFNKKRIRNYCSIITDLDSSYITESNDTFANKSYIKSQINSERSGAQRKKQLDIDIKNNKYVEAFYAKNTFETELSDCYYTRKAIEKVINEEYVSEARAKQVCEELNSTDMATRYHTVLFLANKIGKGWMATMLSEHLYINCTIPEYILNAIKFSLSDKNLEAIYSKIMEFNISKMPEGERSIFDHLDTFEKKLEVYETLYEDDNFIRFIKANK